MPTKHRLALTAGLAYMLSPFPVAIAGSRHWVGDRLERHYVVAWASILLVALSLAALSAIWLTERKGKA